MCAEADYWYEKAHSYEEALREIKENQGKVCAAYDLCSAGHKEECEGIGKECGPWVANDSSYASWVIADKALREE